MQGDLLAWKLPEKLDALFANAVLHWLPEHAGSLHALAPAEHSAYLEAYMSGIERAHPPRFVRLKSYCASTLSPPWLTAPVVSSVFQRATRSRRPATE